MSSRPVALIVAGGLGSRMSRALPQVPKPLVQIAGRSLLEIVLRQILEAGIDDLYFALRHRSQLIIEHIEGLADLPAHSRKYLIEADPLGTAGSLFDLKQQDRTVLVMNGDLLSGVDLGALFTAHGQQAAALTIAVHVERHRLGLGEVLSDSDGRVIDYVEKPLKTFQISSGIYVVEPDVLRLIECREWLGFPELARRAVQAGLNVRAHLDESPWLDVNNHEELDQARSLFARDPTVFGVAADKS